MKSRSVIFSNARIKALENKLLSSMQISRLVDATGLSDAVKILTEYGYGGGTLVEGTGGYEKLFAIEEESAAALLREVSVEGSGLTAFLVKLDYSNAKAVCKADVLKLEDIDFMLVPEGNISVSLLKEEIGGGEYRRLPEPMAKAMRLIDAARLNDKLTPRYIDLCFDRAVYEDIFALLEKSKESLLIDYFTKSVDIANLFSCLRTYDRGLGVKYFEDGFIEGGKLAMQTLSALFEQSREAFSDKLKYTDYAKLMQHAQEDGNLVRAEALGDDMLINVLKPYRNDMFTVAPIAGYYVAKLTEIKVVKLVLACIKNKVDKTALRQRMRELYA